MLKIGDDDDEGDDDGDDDDYASRSIATFPRWRAIINTGNPCLKQM